jgi:tRNA-splicing ligase RtcB
MRKITDKLWSWASILDEQTRLQAEAISRMPFVLPYMAQMADAHFGKGAPVGSVIPTAGAIMPAAVGVDIGCGMIACLTQFTMDDVRERQTGMHLGSLRRAIEEAIPSSMGRYNQEITGTARPRINELYATPGADQASDAAPTWPDQLGSLGGGNHFIEVTVDELNRVWLFLHSGSRGVGNRLAMKHIKAAQQYTVPGYGKPARYKLESPDHAFLDEGTPEFDSYMAALNWAQRFAYLNREEMMDRLVSAFSEWMGRSVIVGEQVNCHHNYTEKIDAHVWLSRKGAIDASAGKLGLIPGSMGAASYVVQGKGNWQSFDSAPHGAGRVHSRGSAKRTFTMEQLEREMQGIEWARDSRFLDEAPGAYKDIDVVMADSEDLVTILHTFHQIVNVKGV